MDYKKLLLSIYNEAKNNICYAEKINSLTLDNIQILAEKCFIQKGVYTVFVTLTIYKILHPQQDIRNHQTQIEGVFQEER